MSGYSRHDEYDARQQTGHHAAQEYDEEYGQPTQQGGQYGYQQTNNASQSTHTLVSPTVSRMPSGRSTSSATHAQQQQQQQQQPYSAYPPSPHRSTSPGYQFNDYGYPVGQYPGSFAAPDGNTQASESHLIKRDSTMAAWQARQNRPMDWQEGAPGASDGKGAGLKRAGTRRVKLTRGHYVVDHKVPTPVSRANEPIILPSAGDPNEFDNLRYTAATVDPDDFTVDNGWILRPVQMNRQTDLLIAITYYNEDKILLARTLHSVMLNVRDMVKAKWSEFRQAAAGDNGTASGDLSWKRIVVSLIFDGVGPADKSALDVLATMGIYQDGIIQGSVDGQDTVAHIFEFTSALSMSPKLKLVTPTPNDPASMVPVQFIFCLKAKNEKKINSHRWLFNGLARQLSPEVVVLIDAGTKPGARSIYYLWEAFYHEENLGGACGEIHAMIKGGKKLINPLVAAQMFEYKVANILDKPTESAFGYVSVLPGAFSAYRWTAIQGRPLSQYFHGDHSLAARLGKDGVQGMSIFKSNMYLAEDRILCFELVAKANARWTLGYVKPSKAETDVPESVVELIGQRRRWLNGSFAASLYSLAHFGRIYRSNHGIIRMFFLHIQAIYTIFGTFLGWFALANWLETFKLITEIVATNLFDPSSLSNEIDRKCWAGSPFEHNPNGTFVQKHNMLGTINFFLVDIYLATLMTVLVLSLGNRPKGEPAAYTAAFVIFGLLAAWLMAATIVLTIRSFCPITDEIQKAGGSVLTVLFNNDYGPIMAGLAGTFGLYILSGLLYLDPWHIPFAMPQYCVVAPSFTNVLNVFAFCNLHDVSWGTKGSDSAASLPKAKVEKDKDKEDEPAVVQVYDRLQADVDADFKLTISRALSPHIVEEEVAARDPDDCNKQFRTRLVAIWLFTNVVLAVAVGRLSKRNQTHYFQALLLATFAVNLVRFLGLLYFLIGAYTFRFIRLCAGWFKCSGSR
ncbi:glycosyltransferase family 2 protein [Mixia osmundae IAM 14324]|uniref:Chitin synthase n=1 Tax=Mixia osmundae (strain CBS 9802 / IAM 14324 / JCM 22182 / KY 12970) TaxID=764103 RepID=G7E4Y8_MIXOS|nr:glycosyltransferase family 2 protein [Mixia osmundae IAM 14324]KEI37759.1 glycosyltransferase family 2 protein [Mixia osmundae IAM 14324]GAA97898.1 hypothetical protein E5Q_04578 [Mixia osmundae IAM 14324]